MILLTLQPPGVPAARCRRFAAAAGLAAAALGALVLAGWALDLAALRAPIPGGETMKASAALGLVLLGAALALRSGVSLRSAGWRALGTACAAAAALLGLHVPVERALSIDLVIEKLLLRALGSAGAATPYPGCIAPQTAACFVLLGAALLQPDKPEWRGRAAQGLALAVGAIALVSLLGYLYAAPAFYRLGAGTGMAVHTAAPLALLAAGVLCARPETGVVALIVSPTAGGLALRRLLPFSFAFPFLAAALRLAGQRAGLYGTEFGLALMTLAAIVILSAFALWIAGSLDRSESEIRRLVETLEDRVRERTAKLEICSRRLLKAQEEERRAIARELHDELGQALTALRLNLEPAEAAGGAPAASAESLALVDRLLDQVRSLSLELHPAILDDLGLVPALRWQLRRTAERAGFAYELAADDFEERLPAETETACFRLAAEALTNVVRHARARHVTVELRRRSGGVELVVRDDGEGFDVEAARAAAARGASLGLLGMCERAELLGGSFEIRSAAGRGTEVRARFPVAAAAR